VNRAALTAGDDGQALIVVAIAMFVLMGALVLTLDWGYGLANRRAMQNEADAATLAASRLLATSYEASLPHFTASQEDVWCAAKAAADANRADRPTDSVETVQVSFSTDNVSFTPDPPLSLVSNCSAIPNGADVPDGTLYVRVRASVSYTSIFGIIDRRQIEAAGSARARLTAAAVVRQLQPMNVPAPYFPYGAPGLGLSGSRTAPNVALWPIVVRYSNWDQACPSLRLVWTGGGSGGGCGVGVTDENFFVSLAHWSPHEFDPGDPSAHRHQLLTESDFSATANTDHGPRGTAPVPNTGPGWCRPDGLWDSNGFARGPESVRLTAQCDVPNWFNYGFGGALSVGTNWDLSDPGWNSFENRRPPPQLTPVASRSSCDSLPTWVTATGDPGWFAPSCSPGGPATRGDWIETLPIDDSLGVNESVAGAGISSFIARYGRDVPGGGDKYVVVNIFLWDCAQQYVGPFGADDAWQLLGDPGDCASSIPTNSVDRVHLLAAVPMTIRGNDVQMAGTHLHLTAEWGDIFGDAGVCARTPTPAGCDLNPLMNSAFLVPDE
jgi:hypothetical protein